VKRLNLLRQPQVGRRRSRLFSIQVFLCANEIFYFQQKNFYESDPQIRMLLHHLQCHTEKITNIKRALNRKSDFTVLWLAVIHTR
jgi:hypothetical protein